MSNYGTISAILCHKGPEIWSIPGSAKVFDAIKLMAEKNVGALLVTEDSKLIGIFSERDYARKVAVQGKNSRTLKVQEIISKDLITVTPRHTVEECMRLMSRHRIRHLPVVDGENLEGIVSIGDLVNFIISAQTETIIQLESYITGQYPGGPG